MHPSFQNQNFGAESPSIPVSGILAAGMVGAAITATLVAARELREVKQENKDNVEALGNIAKESLGGGIAVAAGAAVAKTFFRSSTLGFAAMLAVGIGTKYAYDAVIAKACATKNLCEKNIPAKAAKQTAKA